MSELQSLHEQLFQVAKHLQDQFLAHNAKRSEEDKALAQAFARRSVSTAYYSVFHMLVKDLAEYNAAGNTNPLRSARIMIFRTMNHTAIKRFASQLGNPQNPRSGIAKKVFGNETIPTEAEQFFREFVKLQEYRTQADYVTSRPLAKDRVEAAISAARAAIDNWKLATAHSDVIHAVMAGILLVHLKSDRIDDWSDTDLSSLEQS